MSHVQRMKTLSMYLCQHKDWHRYTLRPSSEKISCSQPPSVIFAYVGAHLSPTATLWHCLYIWSPNEKMLLYSMCSSSSSTNLFNGRVILPCSNNSFLDLWSPSVCGMLEYRASISTIISHVLKGCPYILLFRVIVVCLWDKLAKPPHVVSTHHLQNSCLVFRASYSWYVSARGWSYFLWI